MCDAAWSKNGVLIAGGISVATRTRLPSRRSSIRSDCPKARTAALAPA